MVRLKANLAVLIGFSSSFQFQNGTIKRMSEKHSAVVITIFQFQNGTIKRRTLFIFMNWRLLFQFQNGTIKRELSMKFKAKKMHFNSKMVRLKAL